jgi:hypothetical protein
MTLLVDFILVVFGVWQSVEICHHSQAGTVWRCLAKFLTLWPKPFKFIGDGMSCPYCYSNWFGLIYAFSAVQPTTFLQGVLAFVMGIGAARCANLFNDYFHPYCRTPNDNEDSASYTQAKEDLKNNNTTPSVLTDEEVSELLHVMGGNTKTSPTEEPTPKPT